MQKGNSYTEEKGKRERIHCNIRLVGLLRGRQLGRRERLSGRLRSLRDDLVTISCDRKRQRTMFRDYWYMQLYVCSFFWGWTTVIAHMLTPSLTCAAGEYSSEDVGRTPNAAKDPHSEPDSQ